MATAEARGEGRFSGGAALTRRVAFVRSISSVYLIHAHMQIAKVERALCPRGMHGATPHTRDAARAGGGIRAGWPGLTRA